MSTNASWLDPRPAGANLRLAERGFSQDAVRRIVLLDNGRLGPPFDYWQPVARALLAELAALGAVTEEQSDLLALPPAEYADHIARWRKAGVDGVVMAICDAGVALPTLLLAVAAEQAGIPCVVICVSQTLGLAGTVAELRVPGLPVLCLEADRFDAPERMAAAVAELRGELWRALTAAPAELQAVALQRLPLLGSLALPTPPPGGDAAWLDRVAPAVRGAFAARYRTEAFGAYAAAQLMGDGLPLVTPTITRVQALLSAVNRDPAEVLISELSPSGAALTVLQAAICATMAGCAPRRFALVLAALEAMGDPAYRLELATITTHPSAHIVVFSGSAARAAGIVSGRSCLGPGHEANATVGRSIGLCMINVARAIPGVSSLCLIGSPAQFTCCFADAAVPGFPELAEELAGPGKSIVWVHKAESPHNVMDHVSTTPEHLLDTVASVMTTLGNNGAYMPSDVLLILNPEHAALLHRAGWDRARLRAYLWTAARNPRTAVEGRGTRPERPRQWEGWEALPVAASPERIWVTVAGAPGPQSMVALPWGWTRASWRVVEAAAA